MADRLVSIAEEIEGGEGPGALHTPRASKLEQYMPALASVAENMYCGRRNRDDMFDRRLFGEPAWDMLLDLYVNHVRGKRVSVTSVCQASARPITTALRWVVELENQGLVLRDESPFDNRVSYVDLTKRGVDLLNRYLWNRVTSLPPLLRLHLSTPR